MRKILTKMGEIRGFTVWLCIPRGPKRRSWRDETHYQQYLAKKRECYVNRLSKPGERIAENARQRARYRRKVSCMTPEEIEVMREKQREICARAHSTKIKKIGPQKRRLQRWLRTGPATFHLEETAQVELEQSKDWYDRWFESLDTSEPVW